METTNQFRIKRSEQNSLDMAIRYYSLLSVANNIKLTEREIQLVAFIAVKGNISYSNNREEFCKTYRSSSPTINNMISRLKKTGILIKESGKVKVHSAVFPDFEKDIVIQAKLTLNG